MPAAEKFRAASRWISPSAELVAAVDVRRALASPAVRGALGAASAAEGLKGEIARALLGGAHPVGMLVAVGSAGNAGDPPRLAVIAQGGFDGEAFAASLRGILSYGRAGLSAERSSGRTLYCEGDVRDPFCAMILDGRHIAVGTKGSIYALLPDGPFPKRAEVWPFDAVAFGRLEVGPRLAALFPQGVPAPRAVELVSADGSEVSARIEAGSPEAAGALRIFLEGARSLLVLARGADRRAAEILKGIEISEEGGAVKMRADSKALMDLMLGLRSDE